MCLYTVQIFKDCYMQDTSGALFELNLISCKCISAYVRNKKNQNQVMLFVLFSKCVC